MKEDKFTFRWKRRAAIGAALAILVLIAWLSRSWTLPRLGTWLDVGQPPVRSQYVLVLTGEPNTRPFAAAALLKHGLAEEALIMRVQTRDPEEYYPSHHQQVRQVLLHCGVPDAAIHILDPEVVSTMGEAQNLAAFLAEHPAATVTVVTNDFHSRRARWAIRQAAGHNARRVAYVTVPLDMCDGTNWWKSEEGVATYVVEYGKLAFYGLRYGHGLWWCLGAVLLLGGLVLIGRLRFRFGRSAVPGVAACSQSPVTS